MQSVGDVAHLLEVHEQVVIEWAERNELPQVGREFVLSPRDVRDFERWLNAAGSTDDTDAAAGDDDTNPADEDDEDGGDDESEDEGDDDDDEDEDGEADDDEDV